MPGGPLALYAMQADSMSRFFAITVTDNGASWTPPDGAAWTVRFGASGMPAGWYDTITEPGGGTHAAIVVDENTATVEIAEQAISTPGQNILCVLVTDAQGYQIASWPFLLNVQAVPGLEVPEATVYYNALTAQVAQTLANAQAAAASASAAAASAQEAQEAAASIDTANLVSVVGASAGQYPQATGSGYQWVEITAAGIGAAPEANGVTTYTCTTSGTTHALTGTGNNIKFVADAAFAAGDTVTVNGQAVTAQTQSGEALTDGFWVSGAVVGCYLNGTVLNFRGGGGGGIDPSTATATPGKVLAPYTFFAGGEEIQTGTMADYSGDPLAASASTDGSNVNFTPQSAGYVDATTDVQVPYASVASAIGLTADKIMSGNTILGVAGTGAGGEFISVVVSNSTGDGASLTATHIKNGEIADTKKIIYLSATSPVPFGFVTIQYGNQNWTVKSTAKKVYNASPFSSYNGFKNSGDELYVGLYSANGGNIVSAAVLIES